MSDTAQKESSELYFKILEYKRSIGKTQWTVLSIFLTVSEAILVLGLSLDAPSQSGAICSFGVIVYWLGFCLYNRYRNLNRHVASCLVELEKDATIKFQKTLNDRFHKKGISTQTILIGGGIIYIVFVTIIIITN